MAGYLIAEEGPLEGLVIDFVEGSEWVLGRDPDEASIVLEDPMVSRKHVICHLTEEGFTLENLSSINPATQNGKVITEEVLLKEGDILEIGSTFFRFTEKKPQDSEEPKEKIVEEPIEIVEEEDSSLPSFDFEEASPSRWLLKVISGPNSGAEFHLTPNSSYTLGKDPNICDVVFYDLSVSKKHAKITVDENEHVFIEDLGSRNQVLINGDPIEGSQEILSQDLVALGTTSFLMIDRDQVQDTIFAPPLKSILKEEIEEKAPEEVTIAASTKSEPSLDKNWKDIIIPQKHLIFVGVFALLILTLFTASFSLFKSEEIEVPTVHEKALVTEALKMFPAVQYSLNEATGKLFLVGHVLTKVEKQELSYMLSTLSFIKSIEDTIIIDELVWQNMNAVLLTHPNWQAVSIHSPLPGKFVMKGYVQTPEEAEALADYMNITFPYINLLDNEVNVANTLSLQVESMFLQHGFRSIAFNLSGGDLLITGNVDEKRASDFNTALKEIKKLPGILTVKSFVVFLSAHENTSTIDLSKKYTISGYSSGDNDLQFAIINTKVFETGDVLDGMMITAIEPEQVLLEKDGLKFKINYNLQ
jgi:type III secretion system YscD/HrpQ family protein